MSKLYLNELEQHLIFFNKMYDTVRIVDPVHKQVLKCTSKNIEKTKHFCYSFWENKQVCDNCISTRAYYNKKSYIKLEKHTDAIMLVTALCFEDAEEPVVLELINYATDSFMIGIENCDDTYSLHNIVYDLNHAAIQDHLTSIYNRRFLDERLPADIVRAVALHQPLSIIFIDINNMKNINDTHGHSAGDLALKNTAEAIRDCVQEDSDWIARYGGDEFVLCLNNCSSSEAQKMANKIQKNINALSMPVADKNVDISVSLGVQTMSETPLTAEEILHLADQKMYEEKRRRHRK